ncbi:MAG: MlaD family protein [Campylobacterota bacterium]|nr:MlaD family protein [Campylobacterota bacterium]
MNNKVNYSAIGFIVLVGFSLMMGFVYWLLKPTVDEKTQKYLIYFDESVLGLNVDAPVKYKGISVGRVSKLQISPYNSEQVEVLITILKSTPIKIDTAAKLTAQGITGLSYINLSMGKHSSASLVVKNSEKYPIIKSIPSIFEEIGSSIGDVSNRLTTTLTQTEKLLNDENQKQIALLLTRTANILEKFETLLDEKTMISMQNSVQNVESLTKNIDKMIPSVDSFIDTSKDWEKNIHTSFDSIMNSYLGIRASMDEIRRAVSSGQFNVKEITSDLVPTMNNTLLDMQELIVKFGGSLEQYDRSPSDILFKQEEINKGPGEE